MFLIIGTVAFIEEKGEVNLGLGIPAGLSTIIAAGKIFYFTKTIFLLQIVNAQTKTFLFHV